MMNFEEFSNKMHTEVKEMVERKWHGAEIERKRVEKLNGRSYDGIAVQVKGEKVGTVLNLNDSYERYKGGEKICRMVDSFADALMNAPSNVLQDVAAILGSYETARKHLCIEVVSTESNAEKLMDIPHTEVENMSVVYRIRVSENASREATTLVTNAMMEKFGVSLDQLRCDALENAPNNRPAKFMSVREIILEMLGMTADELGQSDVPPMYILTNENRVQGAAALFYVGQMEKIRERLGRDYFILPSSAHEVIILPDDGTMRGEDYLSMVTSVNASEVAPEDKLTDSVYRYGFSRGFERVC